ncbi:hypothetical protein BYT27DRAFT_7191840 [Phlegmacium glaucopus]|nr:hypothetical protein BYT27DRAFT_7191840 [Phlegmacium glaucopus]
MGYNKLLTYCFGPDSFEFFVAPHSPPSEFSPRDTVDFEVYLVVFNAHRRPVLFAEIKEDAWVGRADLRFMADDQMRQQYNAMIYHCPIPHLWGLNLLGTSLRVYCGNVVTGELEPTYGNRPSPDRIFPRDFLERAWNIDILSQEGFSRMKEIVRNIVDGAAAL